MDVASEKSITDLFICSLSLSLLKAHSLRFSLQGVWLGLQWQWSAGLGKQCQSADPFASGSFAQRVCEPGMCGRLLAASLHPASLL